MSWPSRISGWSGQVAGHAEQRRENIRRIEINNYIWRFDMELNRRSVDIAARKTMIILVILKEHKEKCSNLSHPSLYYEHKKSKNSTSVKTCPPLATAAATREGNVKRGRRPAFSQVERLLISVNHTFRGRQSKFIDDAIAILVDVLEKFFCFFSHNIQRGEALR